MARSPIWCASIVAQYDVFQTPIAALRRVFPYVVVLQSDLIEGGPDRVVAPLISAARTISISLGTSLSPAMSVGGSDDVAEHRLLILGLTNLPAADLKRPVGTVAAHRDAITNALDLLFHGF